MCLNLMTWFGPEQIKSRRVVTLPDVLAVDCNLSNENHLNFWKAQLEVCDKVAVCHTY